MRLPALIVRELRFRWLSAGLGAAGVALAVALFVTVLTLGRAAQRETTRLMRNLGFNVVILPAATDMDRYWSSDLVDGVMPEEYVRRLADSGRIQAEHFVAVLEDRVEWRGRGVFLRGLLPEMGSAGRPAKAPMGYTIARGEAVLGYALAQAAKAKPGDSFEVGNLRLTVRQCLPESGTRDDVRACVNLADAQQALAKPGQINAILALGCVCTGASLPVLRQEIGGLLPDTRVLELRTLAEVRTQTRVMVDRYGAILVPLVFLVGAAWVALLAALNARERRSEIGLLRALGLSGGAVTVLLLARSVAMAAVGALAGFAAGTVAAVHLGPTIFRITAAHIAPEYALLGWAALAAPLAAALAAAVPVLLAVTDDPAAVLTKE